MNLLQCINLRNKIFILFLVFTFHLFPQIDFVKWEKKEITYQLKNNFTQRDYSFETNVITELVTKTFINAYWFFISDLDGDNCPFHPTCSNFFINAVNETNIFQGSLMFGDRFLRDINIINRRKYYSITKNYKLFDPIENYILGKH